MSGLTTDSWQNLITSLGRIERDKRLGAVASIDWLGLGDLISLYRGNDLAARIVDYPADSMVREWVDVLIEGESELQEEIEHKLRDLDTQAKVKQALRWTRAFGGSAIVIGAMDGADLQGLREPLDENRLEDIKFLNVFPAHEVYVTEWYTNPYEANYGEPKVYRVFPKLLLSSDLTDTTTIFEVHESRIMRFNGPVVSREQMLGNSVSSGWGDSILTRVHSIIRDFGASWDSAAHLVTDFSQAVFKVKGLAEAMAEDREGLIVKRMQQIDLNRSVVRGVLLDAEHEDFERKPTPLSGLPELMEKFSLRLAAAARMPVSLLMGQAPSGLNASGASDVRFFYDEIKQMQRDDVIPQLKKLVRLIMLSKSSPTKGVLPDNWSLEFRPLWQTSEVEKADIKLKMAQTDVAYINAGVLAPDEVAQSRFGGDAYSIETQVDMDSRGEMMGAQNEPSDVSNKPAAAEEKE